jgi:hypothetical protein
MKVASRGIHRLHNPARGITESLVPHESRMAERSDGGRSGVAQSHHQLDRSRSGTADPITERIASP